MARKLKQYQAFTIVELLVVIVVIGILAAFALVSYVGVSEKANITSVKSDLVNSKNVLGLYYSEYGAYPSAFDSNNCPSAPMASSSYCLKLSGGNAISSYSTTASGYMLSIAHSSIVYNINQSSAPAVGVAISCPTGFIAVPGSATYETSSFCVMKYEAKNVSSVATSQAAGTPWVSVNQDGAKNAASTACSGCHLITEAEWMTIAQNVAGVSSNWSNGTVGSGYLYSGHNDGAPASALVADTNDSNGYMGETNTGGTQRRTLILNNGETIWDFAGNVWEWTSLTVTSGQPGISGTGFAWHEWPALTVAGSLAVNPFPSGTGISGASSWNTSNGIGGVYTNSDATYWSYGVVRGGFWGEGANAGAFSFSTFSAPGDSYNFVGFRSAK